MGFQDEGDNLDDFSEKGRQNLLLIHQVFLGWTPHPVMVTIRDNKDRFHEGPLIFPLLQRGGPPKLFLALPGHSPRA